jgi:Xaa-Pro aminopeptidase
MPMLHYIENNQQCKAGDLILLDVAAEYANYSSDMSRTIRFQAATLRDKKEVYNAAECQNEATKNADYRHTLETISYRSGEINDFRTAGLAY